MEAIDQISRRHFIKSAGTAGIALWLGLSAKGSTRKAVDAVAAQKFTPYILIESNGNITLFNIKPEMGQGTFQSIPALIAEEFEVSLDQVIIKNTGGEKEFGNGQRAGGSTSVRGSYDEMRKVGAAAKAVFITAASTKWQVNEADCYAENGKIIHRPSQKSASYGELLEEASQIELPKNPKLKDPKDFKIIGIQYKRPDVPMKTNGTAIFGIDVQLPEMVYATVERCPVIGGTLKSFDAGEALKMPGVIKVDKVERIVGIYSFMGVAIIANSYWNATQARKKLKIEWDTKGYETYNSTEYDQFLWKHADDEGLIDKNVGAIDTIKTTPDNTVDANYETPVIAHHTLEPMVCVAQVKGDKVEIWSSTQVPNLMTAADGNSIPALTGFKPENVTYHNMFIGGGFGRRLYYDYIVEAVNVARLTDKPVKVLWSREDATKKGPWRMMTFSKMSGTLDKDGKLLAFRHKVIGPNFHQSLFKTFNTNRLDGSMVEGIGSQDYQIPNLKTSYVNTESHIPGAAFRSVVSSTICFPHESFIDEMAHKAKKDPMEFRLSMCAQTSDTWKLLQKLKELSNWNHPLPKRKGRGVAQWKFFGCQLGYVVEVTHDPVTKLIKIDRVTAVIDLGVVVNPDNVKNQIEGAVIMALSAATKPGITFKNGIVEQNNFYDNPVPRISEAPPVEVHILADGGRMKGVGEPGIPPFAPALANAIFAATGTRYRKMPFDLRTV
ncbi:xanthine dehydrogenase family protein molybdopterin-binding subunit [Mucilaginibacter ginsenosidivorax]|uniref:Xanthine dehydrogenase family protein molybdopterin-binding subunit n=1 Tax=Mucilaginibacter ginsenosidivorax TaxID=862126 RepID=A0A5B8VYD0_9SPHI|nr:molybdopterin cofactor-binding domain-containing protein [Mucilaginibacter ginsenosidivorax]QEC76414.1 xanthine dehydrogenase family protein molybdopterin-binding subunit [Mucilaginibacter ginsenosidivorax]